MLSSGTLRIGARLWLAAALTLTGASAHAVDITAVTAQQNRVEGQGVEVTATLNWGSIIPISSPTTPVR